MILVLCATVLVHIALLLLRGWMISQARKKVKELEARMVEWEKEQERKFTDFEQRHASTWEVIKRKNA